MGAFKEMMEKSRLADREARFKEKMELMKRHGIQMSDLESGKWEIREEGPFGQTVMKVYKLVETVEIVIESKVRAVTTITKEEGE